MTDFYTKKTDYNVTTMPFQKSKSNGTVGNIAAGAAVVGAGVGAVYGGVKKLPIIDSNGVVSDKFTKTVYNKYVKTTADEELKLFEKQRINIIKKIGNVYNTQDLEKLVNENKELIDKVTRPSCINVNRYTKYLPKSIRKFFLNRSKNNIMEGVKDAYKTRLNDISSKISGCFDMGSNTFEKAPEVSDELYKVIKTTKIGMKIKQILKTAGIAGLITGVGTFLTIKGIEFFKNKAPLNKFKNNSKI